MCGIAGILRLDGAPADAGALARMLTALAHRGPDGEGIEAAGPGALGHRRLAIIDPAGGRQPLLNEDGSMGLVCNGEIYNYRALRAELEGHGHRFRSASDSEVALHAYEQWGEAGVERLRGMFALAVMDWGRQRLFLARDALGIKPLLWLQGDGFVAFASELQALRTLDGVRWRIDREALDLYLRLHHIPAPATIFAGVAKLAPGTRLTISCAGGAGEPQRWWRPRFAPLAGRTAEQWSAAAAAALDESVASHLVADVPVGAFLSGGLDSAAVVAAMAVAGVAPLRTFTIGFAEQEFDERGPAAAVAARWGAEHHHEEVRLDALELLPGLVRHFGEPFGDSSAVPAFYAARLARGSVKVVLSGDGGDELFAGYDHHRDWLRWLSPGPARRLAGALLPQAYPPPRADVQGWLRVLAATSARERRLLWRAELAPAGAAIPAAHASALAAGIPEHPLSLAQALDLQVYLPGDLLAKVDITSMMHGLEVRTPFADLRMAEFAATIPPALQAGMVGGRWQGKLLLRRALAQRYPAAMLAGRKRGFAVPLARWFAPGGPLHGALQERLLDPRSPLRSLFRPRAISALVRARRAGPLWLLLVLDEWLRQHPGVAP
jgi:asparagine synthase (glutamine-hydrolysing)